MTAERQDGTTARRRAGSTRQSPLNRAFGPASPATPAVDLAPTPEVAAPSGAPAGKPATSKYTALLDADTAAEFDGLALTARRKLGRKVDKSEIIRSLIRLAADDASLRDQVINELGKG